MDGFYDKVEFKTKIIAHNGSDGWVEKVLLKMKDCMDCDDIPEVGRNVMDSRKDCEFCAYAKARTALTLEAMRKSSKTSPARAN
jgi:hypothetical protein